MNNKYNTKELRDRVVAFRPIFKRKLGSYTCAVLLQQISFWSKTKKDEDGWFYKTQGEWDDEICITRRELETARDMLIEKKLIEYETRGVGNKGYYRLNEAMFDTVFGSDDDTVCMDDKKTKSDAFTPDTADVLRAFAQNINPNCETMYNRKAEREAADYLIKLIGKDNLINKIIPELAKWNEETYLSKNERAFTPHELKRNLAQIKTRMKSKHFENNPGLARWINDIGRTRNTDMDDKDIPF